jgi:hypothetical protein
MRMCIVCMHASLVVDGSKINQPRFQPGQRQRAMIQFISKRSVYSAGDTHRHVRTLSRRLPMAVLPRAMMPYRLHPLTTHKQISHIVHS